MLEHPNQVDKAHACVSNPSSPSFPAARGSLQPWSQGVIAVVVFLVLVAICFVVNRFWCKKQQ